MFSIKMSIVVLCVTTTLFAEESLEKRDNRVDVKSIQLAIDRTKDANFPVKINLKLSPKPLVQEVRQPDMGIFRLQSGDTFDAERISKLEEEVKQILAEYKIGDDAIKPRSNRIDPHLIPEESPVESTDEAIEASRWSGVYVYVPREVAEEVAKKCSATLGQVEAIWADGFSVMRLQDDGKVVWRANTPSLRKYQVYVNDMQEIQAIIDKLDPAIQIDSISEDSLIIEATKAQFASSKKSLTDIRFYYAD